MFSEFGKFFIDSITIFDDVVMDFVACSIVGIIAYVSAYKITGKLYLNDLISGSTLGSLVHWIIRFIIFLMLANILGAFNSIYNFLKTAF